MRLHSVGARLSLALAIVVAGALGVVWIALVPTLQHRLVNGRLSQLSQSARQMAREASATGVDQNFVEDALHTADASRVVVFRTITGGDTTSLTVQLDSRKTAPSTDVASDPVALRAVRAHALERGTVTRDDETFAEVAVPDRFGDVLLFAASLHSTLRNVSLVRDRLLWSGLVALALAVMIGWAAASVFGARLRRLERAAERIAAGDFEQPVADRGRDEIGELANAFDRMRLQLAELDGARRAFIANASHELRTPIFSLGGFLELLRDEELDERTRADFLDSMAEQVERLSKLATDLLDLSRLDAGAVRITRETVDLGEIAEALAEEFSALAVQRRHELEVETAEAGLALADRERLLQVGRALVHNALVHTPAGTTVRISANGAALAVQDDGGGIPAEQRERIFARFTRIDGSGGAGTGLGLAIARELAELMSGDLELELEPGHSRFVLALPAAAADRLTIA
jgi:signal transduction histidine kinase